MISVGGKKGTYSGDLRKLKYLPFLTGNTSSHYIIHCGQNRITKETKIYITQI
jgi:hypothetical protein